MDRPDDPLTLPAHTDWLKEPDVQAVLAAIAAGGGAAWFVGGCVRDALLGRAGADVDLATDCLPQDVTARAEAAGLKAVPTGIEHGTVTVVSGARAIEVTTFRRDVRTDGRHAEVAFSRDMAEDARRRDFTLNALYADAGGRVVDPLGSGVADCLARRIRFIEDAGQRIREDYLRILRFFRFHAWYATAEEGFDPEALDAIARNAAGLETLSAERVGSEMLRLLAAPNPAPALAALQQTGALHRILPGADTRFVGAFVSGEAALGLPPDPVARLAALGGEDPAGRLRLSRKDARHLERITKGANEGRSLREVAYREGARVAAAATLLRGAAGGMPPDPAVHERLAAAAAQHFPVTAADLMPALSGKALGNRLQALEQRWIDSNFTLSHDDLMKMS